MVGMEYKLALNDDFRIGDTIIITSKTGSGWKGMVNSKAEISFELTNNHNDNSIPLLLDGWILVDVNDRWEKMWVSCKENPFQIGFFKSEQDKIEKIKKNESLYLEPLAIVEEQEVVQATNPQNPPIRFKFRTQTRSYNTILPTKDGMVTTARLISKALRNKEKSLTKAPAKPTQAMHIPQAASQQQHQHHHQQHHQQQPPQLSRSAPQTSPIHSHALNQHREQVMQQSQNNSNNNNGNSNNNSHATPPPVTSTQTTQAQNIKNNQKQVQIEAPSTATSSSTGRSSPGPSQSQLGGGKWLANIKSIVNPKGASALNVSKKDDSKKVHSVVMNKSASAPELVNNRNTTNNITLSPRVALAPKPEPVSQERKMLTRVYWRDGTYHTVPVTPAITAKQVCEFCTKKTKVAIFENLFCLYECQPDGSEQILDQKTNIHELLSGWGEDSENHLVCDLNLGTKNTVKSQLRKTLAVNAKDSYDSESELDLDNDDFGQLDNLDEMEPTEEDESIAMMIQEMIKLKHQLQEEDEMIERLAVEEQEVDLLISRLANL